jgi:hypothetical protein
MNYGLNEEECKELTDEELQARIFDLWRQIERDRGRVQRDRSRLSVDVQYADSLLTEAKRRRRCRNEKGESRSLLNLYPPS